MNAGNYIVIDTEADAIKAEREITLAKGFDDPRTDTMRWALPRQRAEGKWCFPAPEPALVAKIAQPHAIEPYDPAWFPVVDPAVPSQ
jgi:hypothetical protein